MNRTPVLLSSDDLHGIFEVIADVCDHWAHVKCWRERLLIGACKLVAGNVGSITGQTLDEHGRFGRSQFLAVVGLPPPVIDAIFKAAIDTTNGELPAETMPGVGPLFAEFVNAGAATAARRDVCTDDEYYASSAYKGFRGQADCDDYLLSVRSVDRPSHVEVLDIDRPHGAPPFTPRDVAVMKLLHDEIAPLVGIRLTTEAHFSVDGLTARLRGVLDLLLDGLSEKEIATRLDLAPATVHGYVGTIYTHFGVNSRAELMAYFIKRQPKLRK